MGGGQQGRAGDKLRIHVAAGGSGYRLLGVDKPGEQVEGEQRQAQGQAVTRTEAELVSFHKMLVDTLSGRLQRDAKTVEEELGFPLGGADPGRAVAQGGMAAAALVAFGAALAKTSGMSPADDKRCELAALALAVVCMLLWFRSCPYAKVQPVERYLNRTLALEGADAMVRAFLEPPLRPDWPARMGAIDLDLHDLPHESSRTEWWYYNCHLNGPDGRAVSAFVCFFRFLKHVDKYGRRHFSHVLTWAVSDVENEKYYSDVLLDEVTPEYMLKELDKGVTSDPILERALREVYSKGNVPLPDRMFQRGVKVQSRRLGLDYEGAALSKDDKGRYVLKAEHSDLPCGLELVFSPRKAAVRHGDNGVVEGKDGDDMFYYCISRCDVSGSVTLPKPYKTGGSAHTSKLAPDVLQVRGTGWYDHEFGGREGASLDKDTPRPAGDSSDISEDEDDKVEGKGCAEKISSMRYSWNWVAMQLEDGTDITAAVLIDPKTGATMQNNVVVIDPEGTRKQFFGLDKDPLLASDAPEDQWTSTRTFKEYPVVFTLKVPGHMDLTISAAFRDQECMTMICRPGFWEGRCNVTGTVAGQPVKGLAFVERNGFDAEASVKSFFKSVGKVVRRSVKNVYPLRPTREEGLRLIATPETEHYIHGVPMDVVGDTLIAPVRAIADRGGKSWRSYGALACVDCVGGDSRDFVRWVAMPEFLHVGSLIVDDIQDESETRRGGPAAHHIYGSALCINAGTAAYFQCEQLLQVPGMSAEDLNKMYKLFFSALRGGHAGQALDINGLDYMMDTVVDSGDADLLEERILAIHMLKTAAPAGVLARMGAIAGKGSERQVEAMGRYFESVGIAFQIMDDVLNLRGLYSKESDKLKLGTALKQLGEDIACGKVTMPIAKAMAMLPDKAARRALWDVVRGKPQDQAVIDGVIQQLEDLGAIDACVEQAEQVVEEAWAALDGVVPDSFAKIMLRAFGWFVIERSQ